MLHFLDPPEEIHPLTREDPSAFSPPPAFGPFRVLHQIGVGALGPVFRTYEPTRDRLVAVKAFRLDIVPEQAQALADALSVATEAGLLHPSIVEPIAAGVEGTVAYRAEEYVAAESLDVAMRHYAPAPIAKVLPFITQLAGAIDFARAAAIGHGALHPRDIFVTPDEARASGFGIVEALERVGIRAPIRRPYSAPERIEGREWSTPADVFALAAIAFELLTGRRPAGTGAQIGALPDGAFATAVHAVLARAMHDVAARRYSSALAFAGALESAARGESRTDGVSMVEAISSSTREPHAPASAQDARAADVPAVEPTPTPDDDELDPVYQALDDIDQTLQPGVRMHDEVEAAPASEPAAPSLFDADERDRGTRVGMSEGDRYVDDFVDEQHAEADARRPLEAEGELEEPVYGISEPEYPDVPERSRPAALPIAVALVIGLLAGFAAGYFVASRGRAVPVGETATASPARVPATPSAATPAQPAGPPPAREFSDQAVTTKPAAPPPTVSEPVPARTPAPAPKSSQAAAPPASKPAPPATAQRGRIVVQSTPPRAGVTVNGQWRGRTPLTLDDVAFGHYVVRIVQPGFRVAREEFTLSAREPSQAIHARLEREAAVPPASRGAAERGAEPPASQTVFTGSLYVDSRPQGANVLLDGKVVGRTPLRLPDVKVGAHVVRLELAEHRPFSNTVRVTAGQEVKVTGSLERFQ